MYNSSYEKNDRPNSRQPSFFSNSNKSKVWSNKNDNKSVKLNSPGSDKNNFQGFGTINSNNPFVPKENKGFTFLPVKTIEELLKEENLKLREEILNIRESFVKEKEILLNRIDKKNDQIIDLRDRLNEYNN
jgi:hypothetical protein